MPETRKEKDMDSGNRMLDAMVTQMINALGANPSPEQREQFRKLVMFSFKNVGNFIVPVHAQMD